MFNKKNLKDFISINYRILLFALFILLPIYILVLYNFYEQKKDYINLAEERSARLVDVFLGEQKNNIKSTQDMLFSLSQLDEVKSHSSNVCPDAFQEIVERNYFYDNLGLLDINGNVICSVVESKDLVNYSKADFFENTLKNKSLGIGDYFKSPITGKNSINFGYPVFLKDDEIKAVIFANMDLLWFDNFVKSIDLPDDSAIMIFDEEGKILSRYPDINFIDKNVSQISIVKNILAKKDNGTIKEIGIDNVERVYSYASLNELDVFVMIGFSESYIYAEAVNLFQKNIVYLFIISVVIILVAIFLGEKLLYSYIKKLEELNSAKDTFISIASHQLVTPITAMRWNLDAIRDESSNFSVKQKKELTDVYELNLKMKDLISTLLNVSRLDTDSFEINPIKISVEESIKNIIKELQPKIIGKNIKLKEKYDKQVPNIMADDKFLHIIFDNVIGNAIKYSRKDGEILIEMTLVEKGQKIKGINIKKGSILIMVTDSGFGIPKTEQAKIFGKMFRAKNIQGKIDGTGLGLYIVKTIIDHIKGQIFFDSKENKGTTFYIALPLFGMNKKEGRKSLN